MTKTDRCEQEFMSVCFRYNGELFFSYWEKIIVLKEIFFCHDIQSIPIYFAIFLENHLLFQIILVSLQLIRAAFRKRNTAGAIL